MFLYATTPFLMKVDMSSLNKSTASSSSDDQDPDNQLKRGPWTVEEDTTLIHYIAYHGERRWNLLAKSSGLKRTGKSCRLRWLNYLKPNVKRGNLSPEEQLLILELQSKWGNRWSKIAQHLPGRTDNEIKNYWRTRVQKQARQLKIDSNSTAFQELIRRFWIPQLLQTIQGSSSSSPSSVISSHNLASSAHQPLINHHNTSETTYSLDHKNYSSSVASSEISMVNISHNTQISECTTSLPFQAMGNISDYNTFLKGCYNVDNISYEMESFNRSSMGVPGDLENSIGANSGHVNESDWNHENGFADSLWDMDELVVAVQAATR